MVEITASNILKGCEFCVNDDIFINQNEITEHMAHLKFDSNKVSTLNIIEMCTSVKNEEKKVLQQLKEQISKEIDKKIQLIDKDLDIFNTEKSKIMGTMVEKGLPQSFDLSKVVNLNKINSLALDVEKFVHSLELNILTNMKSISDLFRKDGILIEYETLRLSLSKFSKSETTNYIVHSFDNHQFSLYDPFTKKDMKYHSDLSIESAETILCGQSIFIVGGLLNQIPTNKTYEFNIKTGTFAEKEPMLANKWCHTLTSYKDNIFSLGGLYGSAIDDCEKYNVKTGKWEKVTPLLKKKYWVGACAGTFPYVPKEKEVKELKGVEYYTYKYGQPSTTDMLYCIGGTNYYSDFDVIERMEIPTNSEWEPMFIERNEGWSAKKMICSVAHSSKNEVIIFAGTDVFNVTMREEKAKLKLTRDYTEAQISKMVAAEKQKISSKKNVPVENVNEHDIKVAKDMIVEENINEIRHCILKAPYKLKVKDFYTNSPSPFVSEGDDGFKVFLVGMTRNLHMVNCTKGEVVCVPSDKWNIK